MIKTTKNLLNMAAINCIYNKSQKVKDYILTVCSCFVK